MVVHGIVLLHGVVAERPHDSSVLVQKFHQINPDLSANGCNLEALTKPRCKDVEEVRVQLLGTGEFTSFKSAILHISILNGSQLLRFLLRAWQQAMLIRAEGC